MKIDVSNIAELVALLLAVYCYPYLRQTYMKWFLPFLLFVFLSGLAGIFQVAPSTDATVPVDYFIGMVESVFYGYIYYRLSDNASRKKQTMILMLCSVAGYVLSYCIYGADPDPFIYNKVVSGLMLSAVALLYLYDCFGNDSLHMSADTGFWLSFGICLFYPGSSIVLISWKVISTNHVAVFGQMLYHFVPKMLCVLLYGSICLALVSYTRKKMLIATRYGK